MTLNLTAKGKLANELLIRMNAVPSFYGITVAKDLSVNTQLDITVGAGAWVLLGDGQFHDTNGGYPLASTNITGLTVNGTYTLWCDQTVYNSTTPPAFTVSVVAPSIYSAAIATVVVGGNVITSVILNSIGLQGPNFGSLRYIQGKLTLANTPSIIGVLPANAILDYGISAVDTVFNAGTNNFIELGKTGTLAAFLTSATNGLTSATTAILSGLIPGSIGATAVPVIATYTQSGSAGTTGSTTVTLFYHLP